MPAAVMEIKELPAIQLGPKEVLVKVHAIGINPVETYLRSGKYTGAAFPWTPGQDAAGVVEAVGADVTRFKVGDRVFSCKARTGAYAEKLAAPVSAN
jgi:NADPH2:quinone reductase